MKNYFIAQKGTDNHKFAIITDAEFKNLVGSKCYREEYLDLCIKSVVSSMKSAKAVYYEQEELVSLGEHYVCKSIEQARAVKRIELRLMIECLEENFSNIDEMFTNFQG